MSIVATHGKNQAGPEPSVSRGWILAGVRSNAGCPVGRVVPRRGELPGALGMVNRRPVGANLLPEASEFH
jgi:hypothetical protein